MADALRFCSLVPSSQLPICPFSPSFSQSRVLPKPAHDAVGGAVKSSFAQRPNRLSRFQVHAVVSDEDGPKWWERNNPPNMIDVHSTQEFLAVLSQAGDKLVIVEFYGTWCGSCKALFPKMDFFCPLYASLFRIQRPNPGSSIRDHNCKLCRTAQEHPDVIFVKVNFDENKPMCKRLNVRVLPYFHFYRGADGLLESFSCSLAKFQKIKDAIAVHNTARCSIGPPTGVGNLLETSTSQEKTAEASSR